MPAQAAQHDSGDACTLPTWNGRRRSRKARLASRRRRIGSVYSFCGRGSG
jgi:hypothetical protein